MPTKLRRSCGTMAAHMMLLERYPAYRQNLARLELATDRMRTRGVHRAAQKLVTIKVVVNVVWHDAEQNVSKSQIDSQIAVLNRDFRARNSDKKGVPAPWKGLVGDTLVQFKCAKITRTKTLERMFGVDDGVKRSVSGGIAPYAPRTHLNLWVCALGGGLLGYAQFPGGPNATDGVVINYQAFGSRGTAKAPFNKGRTATHEIGHYLNLRHIWADTPDCSGSDLVADTPNCAGPNYGTPHWPSISCRNGPNGDMFMNYMDYVDDDAMFMFTPGQVLRMRATLAGPRGGLTR
ncbi:MAG: zinc metalloprotease [Steroidobacteraceae bacterium]